MFILKLLQAKVVVIFVLLINVSIKANSDVKQDYDNYRSQLDKISNRYPNQADSAIRIFNQMLISSKSNYNYFEQIHLLNAIGMEYCYKNKDMGSALQYFTEAKRIAQSQNMCEEEILSFMYQNLIVFSIKDYKRFIRNYQYIEKLYQKCPTHKRIIYVYTQLAINYWHTINNLDKAKYYFAKVDSVLSHYCQYTRS